jgi:hypothetical protein
VGNWRPRPCPCTQSNKARCVVRVRAVRDDRDAQIKSPARGGVSHMRLGTSRPYVRLAQRRSVSRHARYEGCAGRPAQSLNHGRRARWILSPTLGLMCTRLRSPSPWPMSCSAVGRFRQSSRRCAQDGRAARATGAAVEVLLRSWPLRLWPASVFNRAWACLHGCCAVADPNQRTGAMLRCWRGCTAPAS